MENRVTRHSVQRRGEVRTHVVPPNCVGACPNQTGKSLVHTDPAAQNWLRGLTLDLRRQQWVGSTATPPTVLEEFETWMDAHIALNLTLDGVRLHSDL